MKKILFIALMAIIIFPFNADSKKRTKQQRKLAQKSVQQKTQQVFEEIDEEEAKAFAYSYFRQQHSCNDVSKNKRFFVESSYKVLNSKIKKMLKNFELTNPGDDPFVRLTGANEGFELVVKSFGDGIFEGAESNPNEYVDDVDPYEMTELRIKVVKENGKYKILALYDFVNGRWVPGI